MNDKIRQYPEWKELMENYRAVEYGTFVPHKDIESVLSFSRFQNPNKYYAFVEKWKKDMLKQESKQIECIHKSGYKIIEPQEFRSSVRRQLKFAHRRTRKAGEIHTNTPVELLSPEEKQKTINQGVVLTQLLYYSKAANKKIKQIDRKVDKLLLDVGKAMDVGD